MASDKTKKTRIVYQKDVYDFETGEVKSSQKDSYLKKEPSFIKLYLDDIVALSDVPKWVTGILHELLKLANYENEIVLNAAVKKRIGDALGVGARSVDNALANAVKGKILFRKEPGIYLANPYLFGKGDWKDIKKLRLQVDYTPSGRILRGEVTKGPSTGKQLEEMKAEMAA